MRPDTEPLGLDLTRTGRLLGKAFNDALVDAGGSLPQWLVLMHLRNGDHPTQRGLAAAVGIEGATLTHHLGRMEADGLIKRTRADGDRRTQVVVLTKAGEKAFTSLLSAVIDFDTQLRTGFSDAEVTTLHGLLARLRDNLV